MTWLKQLAIVLVGLVGRAYAADAMRTKTKYRFHPSVQRTSRATQGYCGGHC
jgi:hypothetical protein